MYIKPCLHYTYINKLYDRYCIYMYNTYINNTYIIIHIIYGYYLDIISICMIY